MKNLFKHDDAGINDEEADSVLLDAARRRVHFVSRSSRARLSLRELFLKQIPPLLSLAQHLLWLDISRNQLRSLPSYLGSLKHLQSLLATDNLLDTLPDSLVDLQNLARLDVSGNRLRTLPGLRTTNYWPRLEQLVLSNNNLSLPNFPKQLVRLRRLWRLELRGNTDFEVHRLHDLAALLKHFGMNPSDNVTAACHDTANEVLEERVPLEESEWLLRCRGCNGSSKDECEKENDGQQGSGRFVEVPSNKPLSCVTTMPRMQLIQRNAAQDCSAELQFRLAGGKRYLQMDGVRLLMLSAAVDVVQQPRLRVFGMADTQKAAKSFPFDYFLVSPIVAVQWNVVTRSSSQVMAQLELPLTLASVEHEHLFVFLLKSDVKRRTCKRVEQARVQIDSTRQLVSLQVSKPATYCVVSRRRLPTTTLPLNAYTSTSAEMMLQLPPSLNSSSLVKLTFPPQAVSSRVTVRARCELADDVMAESEQETTLAAPMLVLEPHGQRFNKPVRVQLPVPQMNLIAKRCKLSKPIEKHLCVLHCEDPQRPRWKELDSDELKLRLERNNSLSFEVRAFCGLKLVWRIAEHTLRSIKLGVRHLYPPRSYPMICIALIHTSAFHNEEFALILLFLRPDSRLPEPYRAEKSGFHRVGGTTLPVEMRPGALVIRLASTRFQADDRHGEKVEMCQMEWNFCGVEFEKQFACRWTKTGENCTAAVLSDGTLLGKVFVHRLVGDYHLKEPLFQFNLQCQIPTDSYMKKKSLFVAAMTTDDSTNESMSKCFSSEAQLTLDAVYSFVEFLQMDADQVWPQLATQLGCTLAEQLEFRLCERPLGCLIERLIQRGATRMEVFRALYVIKDLPTTESVTSKSCPHNPIVTSTPVKINNSLYCATTKPRFVIEETNNNVILDDSFGDDEADNEEMDALPEGCSAASLAKHWRQNQRFLHQNKIIKKRLHTLQTQDETKLVNNSMINLKRTREGSTVEQWLHHFNKKSSRRRSLSAPSSLLASSSEDLSDLEEDYGVHCPPSKKPRLPKLGDSPTRSNETPLNESQLWDVSGLLSHVWRRVGRDLRLTETDLVDLEHRYREDLRELAYQMLLTWQMARPEECVSSKLKEVLCRNGLRAAALKIKSL